MTITFICLVGRVPTGLRGMYFFLHVVQFVSYSCECVSPFNELQLQSPPLPLVVFVHKADEMFPINDLY